jgi:hypothetical protein
MALRDSVAIELYSSNAPTVCPEKGVLYSGRCSAHYNQIMLLLKVNKLFKVPHFNHGWGSWIVSLGKESVLHIIHT